ncbi:MAG: hypothetical protein V4722_11370 [Bacteroidota bacterium]
MKKHHLFLLLATLIWKLSPAQNVGIGTTSPQSSARLDVTSTTSGFLLPRMNSGQRTSIISPVAGLQVYDITTNSIWFYNGSGWTEMTGGGGDAGFWSPGTGGSIYNNNPWRVMLGTSELGPGYLNIKVPVNGTGLFLSETGTTAGDFFNMAVGGGAGTPATRLGIMLGNFGNGMLIANQANAPIFFQTFSSEKMRITPAGMVGIGTINPTSQLEVQSATGAAGITHTNGTIRLSTMMNSATSAAIGTTTNHPLFFYTNNTFPPAVTISTAGNLGVGGSIATGSSKVEAFTANDTYGFLQSSAGGVRVGTYANASGGYYGTLTNHPLYLFSQTGNAAIALLQNGNVGIGNNLPSEKLTVQTPTNNYGLNHTDGNVSLVTFVGGSAITAGWLGTKSNHPIGFFTNNSGAQMVIQQNGSVGIGPFAPTNRLHVSANSASNGYGQLLLEETENDFARLNFKSTSTQNSGNNFWSIAAINSNTRSSERLNFYNFASGDIMTLTGDGNVGIGTSSPTYKLSVNGNIRSKEVVVETGWADYVFDEDYQLAPLEEVGKFIRENKHLPNIPSAKEVEAKGVNLGDMQKRMMEKIEELTLYVIELKAEMEKLKTNQSTSLK